MKPKRLKLPKSRNTRLWVGAGVVAILALLTRCDRPDALLRGIPEPHKVAESLKADEKAKIIVGRTGLVKAEKGKDGKVTAGDKFVPQEGHSEITIKDSGEVVVRVKNKGFCFRPGVGISTSGDAVGVVADVKFAYWNRVGATMGTGLRRDTVGKPYVAVSYQIYNNTALFAGLNIKDEAVVGIRLSF